jgi:hypothetical protein
LLASLIDAIGRYLGWPRHAHPGRLGDEVCPPEQESNTSVLGGLDEVILSLCKRCKVNLACERGLGSFGAAIDAKHDEASLKVASRAHIYISGR